MPASERSIRINYLLKLEMVGRDELVARYVTGNKISGRLIRAKYMRAIHKDRHVLASSHNGESLSVARKSTAQGLVTGFQRHLILLK